MREDNDLFFKQIRCDDVIPDIQRLRDLYTQAKEEEYIHYIEYLVSGNHRDEFECFLYYLLLFRDLHEIQQVLNSKRMPVNLIERLFMFSYGYISQKYGSPDKILDDLLFFLNDDTLFRLCIDSEFISRDYILVFFILTRVNMSRIDEYFSKAKDIGKAVKSFSMMPDSMIKEIIYRNVSLFEYITSIMPAYLDQSTADAFFAKHSEMIGHMRQINNLLKQYANKVRVCPEKDHLSRLSILVHLIRKTDQSRISLDFFNDKIINADSNEILLAHEIATNPVYSNIIELMEKSCYFESSEIEFF